MQSAKDFPRHLIELCGGMVAVLGLILAASPFVHQYPISSGFTTINVALGALIASFGALRAFLAYDARSMGLINMVLGTLAILMPWMMGATYERSFFLTFTVCGAGVVFFALMGVLVSQRYRPIGNAPWLGNG